MLLSLGLTFLLAPQSSLAAEVVWLSPPDDMTRAFVAEQAGASLGALTSLDLRSAATAWTPADQAAYNTLDTVLQEVRTYETKFDGELVIMRDLAGPIAAIGVVRDETDRSKLYAALAYQGFAVNRYFDTALGEDDQAEPYRMDLNGLAIEKPWFDAVALDPDRSVTPYDIAEAPQRVQYGKVQEMVKNSLPASLAPAGLPEGSELVIDGRETEVGAAGNIKLVPGRHLIHVQTDDAILARWDLTLASGDSVDAEVPLTDAIWTGFLDGLAQDGASVPAELHASIDALGGEVWVGIPGDELAVYKVTTAGVEALELERPRNPNDPAPEGGFSFAVAGTTGWFYDGNFYRDNPSAGANTGTVNSGALGLITEGVMDFGMLRIGAGMHTQFTLGSNHFSTYAADAKTTRFRPYPHVLIGHRNVQATFGFQFPHHPAVGGNLIIPVGEPFELRGFSTLLIPLKKTRANGTEYAPWVAGSAGVSLGLRI